MDGEGYRGFAPKYNGVNPRLRGDPLSPIEQLEMDVYSLGRRGSFEGALDRIGEFESSVAAHGDQLRAALLRGQVLHTAGRVEEAVAIYQDLLDRLSDDPRSQAICCVELLAAANHLGDLNLAESVAQRALLLVRRRPEALPMTERIYVNYAISWQLRGDQLTAIDWFRRALRRLEDAMAPSNRDRTCGMAIAWYGLVKSYVAQDDLVKARFAIDGINRDRNSRTAACLAALAEWRLHHRLRAWDRAERWVQQAEASAPNTFLDQEVWLARILTAHAQGNEARAREYASRLQQLPGCLSYEVRSALSALTWRNTLQ